ncbi:helix-turn-helix domain-containing protein [Hyphomonas sp.]|uniref:helix-turn-helix domain-containing protein n=1 Tax=Hyphomonas sp. TaxID=87 RepID=UPI00391B2897
MSESKSPSGVDRAVGQRIRWRRREMKLTQEKLGEILDLTFQQVQKYEKGVNRVSAGRLYEIASVLDVPVGYFFEGLGESVQAANAGVAEGEDEEGFLSLSLSSEDLELIAAFQKIGDAALRRSLLDTVKAAASATDTRDHDA